MKEEEEEDLFERRAPSYHRETPGATSTWCSQALRHNPILRLNSKMMLSRWADLWLGDSRNSRYRAVQIKSCKLKATLCKIQCDTKLQTISSVQGTEFNTNNSIFIVKCIFWVFIFHFFSPMQLNNECWIFQFFVNIFNFKFFP